MKCESAQESLMLASFGELSAEQMILVERHTMECEVCRGEMAAIEQFVMDLDDRPLPEPSPNLLADSRMRLDAALDEMPAHGMFARFRMNWLRWVGTIQSAPALATLLLGCGFLAGNFTYRYQMAHASLPPAPLPPTVTPDNANSSIANVSGVVKTENPEIVQVLYNRIVPEAVEGSLNDPQIRALLMIGIRSAAPASVRQDAVGALGHECLEGHACPAETDGKGIRSALLTALRTDRDPTVRERALESLQPYVGQDRRVRDALLMALLHDASPNVRREAIGLLGPVQADSSVRQVLREVSRTDDNPYIRTVSYQALQGADSIQ